MFSVRKEGGREGGKKGERKSVRKKEKRDTDREKDRESELKTERHGMAKSKSNYLQITEKFQENKEKTMSG